MVQEHYWNGNRYIDANGYWARFLKDEDGKTITVLMHREVMSQVLGRPVLSTEIVHHKDCDKKNNSPENLDLLTRSSHAAEHSRTPEKIVVTCVECGKVAEKFARNVRGNKRKNREGPFCGRVCAGRRNQRLRVLTGERRGGRPRPSGWSDEDALRLFSSGLSSNAVAKMLGASRSAVVRVLNNHNNQPNKATT